MWNSHLNGMEIPETNPFIPKGTAVGPFGLQKDIDRLNGFTSAIFVGTSNVIGETSPLLFEK